MNHRKKYLKLPLILIEFVHYEYIEETNHNAYHQKVKYQLENERIRRIDIKHRLNFIIYPYKHSVNIIKAIVKRCEF
jgi:hypothetical protein